MVALGWLDKPGSGIGSATGSSKSPASRPWTRAARSRAAVPAGPLRGDAHDRAAGRARPGPRADRREDHRAPAVAMLSQVGGQSRPTAPASAGPSSPTPPRTWSRWPWRVTCPPAPVTPHRPRGDPARDPRDPRAGLRVRPRGGQPRASCIGAPIFGRLGEVVAALSVTGPSAMSGPTASGPRCAWRRPRRPGCTCAADESTGRTRHRRSAPHGGALPPGATQCALPRTTGLRGRTSRQGPCR